MAMNATLVDYTDSNRRQSLDYTVAMTGSYTTGGDTVNLLTAANPNGIPKEGPITVPGIPPKLFDINAGGFYAQLKTPNPATLTYTVQWFNPGGTEVAAGAYPAAILAATLLLGLSVKKGF